MKKISLRKMAKTLNEDESPNNRIKVTITLPGSIVSSLERNQAQIRSTIDPCYRNKVNKSLLIELAVKTAMDDFEKKGTTSQFYVNTEKQFYRIKK